MLGIFNNYTNVKPLCEFYNVTSVEDAQIKKIDNFLIYWNYSNDKEKFDILFLIDLLLKKNVQISIIDLDRKMSYIEAETAIKSGIFFSGKDLMNSVPPFLYQSHLADSLPLIECFKNKSWLP